MTSGGSYVNIPDVIAQNTWLTLLGGIVGGGAASGFLATQLNARLAERQKKREQLSRALAEMLEVRHSVRSIDEISRLLSEKAGVPHGQLWGIFNVALPQILPGLANVHQRYDVAVTAIAGIDPLLAFELRSKDMIATVGRWSGELAAKDSTAQPMLPVMRQLVVSTALPALDRAILRLGRAHGFATWWKVRRHLKKHWNATELSGLLDPLIKQVASSQSTSAPEPPSASSTATA